MKRTPKMMLALAVAGTSVLSWAPGRASADFDLVAVEPAVSTEMIVWLEPGSDPVDVAAANGVALLRTLVGHRNIHLYGSVEPVEDDKVKKVFDKDDRVRYAEPNYEGASADGNRAHAWPSDQRPSITDGAADGQSGESLRLDLVHEATTGAGAVVAILDTGIDADHEMLAGRVASGWDFVDDDADADDERSGLDTDGDGMSDETWGHGTHVAGIVTQVAPDAEIVSYRVLDSEGVGSVFAVAAAIFDATDRGVDVINLSFGLERKSRSKMLHDALKYAKDGGVIVIAAAGNDGLGDKRYPAADKDVLAVGAQDRLGEQLASFANHGDWVEVAAPGVGVLSALPGGGFGTWSGSSMAAPFVAGQAALLAAVAPDEKPKKLIEAIRKSSHKPGRGNKVKHGMIDIIGSLDELD